MAPQKIPEFILLSELIQKLEDKEYYQVFAKTLLMTASSEHSIPPDNELVNEMFRFFIKNGQLNVNLNNVEVTIADIESEINRRISPKGFTEELELAKNKERARIWKNEIYVKVKDLKKLYANKCIVLPNSLFIDKNSLTEPSK